MPSPAFSPFASSESMPYLHSIVQMAGSNSQLAFDMLAMTLSGTGSPETSYAAAGLVQLQRSTHLHALSTSVTSDSVADIKSPAQFAIDPLDLREALDFVGLIDCTQAERLREVAAAKMLRLSKLDTFIDDIHRRGPLLMLLRRLLD